MRFAEGWLFKNERSPDEYRQNSKVLVRPYLILERSVVCP
ncbi:hypothetical protein CKA32_004641 [Geitlerinema sp. FC II]|nr:hypothetical protein CKA32_004641 [Geitlerinema sp. FC II]